MNGRLIASERPEHSILEGAGIKPFLTTDYLSVDILRCLVPNPLGVVAVLSAFNFPVAVYGWYVILITTNIYPDVCACRNLALSMTAGNATIWKPSPTTPLCSIAVTKIISRVLEENGIPGAVASLVTGGKDAGEALVNDPGVELGKIISINHATSIPDYSHSLFHWQRTSWAHRRSSCNVTVWENHSRTRR